MVGSLEPFIIPVDGRWTLDDLYRFPRSFEQLYFALEALLPTEDQADAERIEYAFRAFPWQGGYSAVSFYNQLKMATPPQRRPFVSRINYASPGVFEFYLALPIAVHIGSIVTTVAGTIQICNKVYHSIYADMRKRELLKIEVERKRMELSQDDIRFLFEASDTLTKMMDIGSAHTIHDRTKNPLISLKILLSVYRRVRTLAAFKVKGKANLRSISEMIEDGDL